MTSALQLFLLYLGGNFLYGLLKHIVLEVCRQTVVENPDGHPRMCSLLERAATYHMSRYWKLTKGTRPVVHVTVKREGLDKSP